MTSVSHLAVDELRVHLLDLVESCPVDQCNPEDCPLRELRNMPDNQRHEWFNALSESDLQYLAVYHHVCMKVRLSAEPAMKDARP